MPAVWRAATATSWALIISDIENPFFPGLIKAFESAALRHGFDVLLCTTNYEPARTEGAFRKMIENQAPAVAVMTSRVDPALARMLEQNDVASILLDSSSTGPRKSDVRLNYATGTFETINYLHNLATEISRSSPDDRTGPPTSLIGKRYSPLWNSSA